MAEAVPKAMKTSQQRRGGIFIRVSQNREDDKGKPERQLKRCRVLAEAKGIEVVEVYTDDGVSAYGGNSGPKRDQALADLRSGHIDDLLCLHVDRFLRDTGQMLEWIELAKELGSNLLTCESGEIDVNSAAGRMVAVILASVAQNESERKSERHKLKVDQLVQAGMSTGGAVPFGWEKVPVGTFLHPVNSVLLRQGILDHIEGVSLGTIARTWNEAGATTTFGNPWSGNSVKKVLIRPRNAGLVEHKGQILEGVTAQWEPVCSVEEWRLVVQVANGRQRAHYARRHLLGGIPLCERCDGRFIAGTAYNTYRGKVYRYSIYKCPACYTSLRTVALDKYVRDAVRLLLTFGDPEVLAPSSTSLEAAVRLRADKGATVTRLDELEALWGSGDFSTANYKKERAKLVGIIAELDERLDDIEKQNAFAAMLSTKVLPIESAVEVGRRFDSLELHQRREIVRGLFPRISINKPGRGYRPPIEQRVTLLMANGLEYRMS